MTPIHLRTTAAFLALFALAVGLRLHAAEAPAVDAHGDSLPRHARLRLGTERFRQGGTVAALRFAPDGKSILSVGDDQVLRWWDAGTGKEQRHYAASNTGALSPDGKTLATIDFDSTQQFPYVRLWDTLTGKAGHQLGSRQQNVAYSALLFSPDGKVLAAVEQDNNNDVSACIRLWETATGKELQHLQGPAPKEGQTIFVPAFLRFSPDGKLVVAPGNENNNNNPLFVWDIATGRITLAPPEFKNTDDDKPHDQVGTHGVSPPSPIEPESGSTLFSPDGKLLASLVVLTDKDGSNHTRARLWDVATGKKVRDLGDFPSGLNSLLFDPTGRTLALLEQNNQTVHFYDVESGKKLSSAAARSTMQGLTFAPDGKTLAYSDYTGVVLLWDVVAGKELHELKGFAANQTQAAAVDGTVLPVPILAFSPDGRTLAASGGVLIRRWDVATGKEIVLPHSGHEGGVLATVVSPDGKLVISVGADDTVRFWDVAAGKEIRQIKRPNVVNPDAFVNTTTAAAAVSADGKQLAVGWGSGQIMLWDTGSGKELLRLKGKDGEGNDRDNPHDNGVSSLAFAPNGKALASAGPDGRVFWWDLTSGKLLRQFAGPLMGDVGDGGEAQLGPVSLALSPDGRTLALTSIDDQSNFKLQLIEIATGKQRRVFRVRNETGNVPNTPNAANLRGAGIAAADALDSSDSNGATFAPDGKTLAWTTGTSIRLWDLVRGRELRRFGLTEGSALSTVFSPDGKYLSSASREGMVYLWETATGTLLGHLTGHRGPVQCAVFAPGGKTLVSAGIDTTLLLWDVPGFLVAEQAPPGELSEAKLKTLWEHLAREDSEQAEDAGLTLLAAPKQAAAFFRERIKAVPPPDANRIEQLLDDLEAKAFPVRKKAEEELEKLGELAEPALRKRLADGPALEAKTRMEALVRKLTEGVPHPEQLRALRVVEVLEQMGTPEARALLRTIAAGAPESRLTQQAQASLDRLGRRD